MNRTRFLYQDKRCLCASICIEWNYTYRHKYRGQGHVCCMWVSSSILKGSGSEIFWCALQKDRKLSDDYLNFYPSAFKLRESNFPRRKVESSETFLILRLKRHPPLSASLDFQLWCSETFSFLWKKKNLSVPAVPASSTSNVKNVFTK